MISKFSQLGTYRSNLGNSQGLQGSLSKNQGLTGSIIKSREVTSDLINTQGLQAGISNNKTLVASVSSGLKPVCDHTELYDYIFNLQAQIDSLVQRVIALENGKPPISTTFILGSGKLGINTLG